MYASSPPQFAAAKRACALLVGTFLLAGCSAQDSAQNSAESSSAASSSSSAPSTATAETSLTASTATATEGSSPAPISAHPESAPGAPGAAEPASFHSFSMDGPATVSGATFASMPYVLPLNPAGPQATMVRWVEGWGQSPWTAELGTTYVLGHAWGQAPLVFNPISEVVTANVDFNNPQRVPGDEGTTIERFQTNVLNGSKVRMSGPDVDKTWVITNAYLVDKNMAAYDTGLINEHDPGRLVLIACSVDGSTDLNYNVIVEGRLAH